MDILQNSLLARFLTGIWYALLGGWTGSVPGRALRRVGEAFHSAAEASFLWDLIWREGTLPRSWPHSIACNLLSILVNLPCALCRWLYRVGRRLWDGSAAFRLVTGLGGSSFVFLGLLMLVMLIAPHGAWNNVYGFAGAAGITVLFALGCAARPKRRLELERLGPYMTIYMAFIVYALLTSIATRDSMRFFFFHLTGFLLVLLLVSAVRKPGQLQLVVALAVLGITIAALYGCYQSYQGVEVIASQQDMSLNVGMPGRIYSFFDNPNNFAELLAMLIPLDVALLLNARGWRGKLLALAALVPCVAAIGFTLSRSSWIGLVVAILVFLALQNWRLIPLMLVLGLCAIPFLPESIVNRIGTIGNMKDSSTRYRFAIYDATANLMKDYWFRGVGLGTDVMKQVFQTYPTMFDGNYPIHTHNNYLQMWGEIGILGALSYVALLLWQLKTGVKAFYASTSRQVRNLLSAAIGGFCGIMVIGLAEYTWFYPRNMFTYWFLFGVIAACVKLTHLHANAKE